MNSTSSGREDSVTAVHPGAKGAAVQRLEKHSGLHEWTLPTVPTTGPQRSLHPSGKRVVRKTALEFGTDSAWVTKVAKLYVSILRLLNRTHLKEF